jgi:hypothetical protein
MSVSLAMLKEVSKRLRWGFRVRGRPAGQQRGYASMPGMVLFESLLLGYASCFLKQHHARPRRKMPNPSNIRCGLKDLLLYSRDRDS